MNGVMEKFDNESGVNRGSVYANPRFDKKRKIFLQYALPRRLFCVIIHL